MRSPERATSRRNPCQTFAIDPEKIGRGGQYEEPMPEGSRYDPGINERLNRRPIEEENDGPGEADGHKHSAPCGKDSPTGLETSHGCPAPTSLPVILGNIHVVR